MKYEVYEDSANDNRKTYDADRNDENNYGFDVRLEMANSGTSVVSFELITQGVTLLQQGTPQGENNGMLPVKLRIDFDELDETFATARYKTADGQQFDNTLWFKEVVK